MIHGVDAPFRYRFQKLHCSYHIYSYVLWQEKDFANPNPSKRLKNPLAAHSKTDFKYSILFFYHTCFNIEYQG
ncbi:hypothetical protein NST83_23245 [Paenibacillus sp. FSL R10-2782]|uniref:hypothetical protein n=1 Tax=Paenibacillus sp. FSL R10-2782 TaxID=2954661 RepID=UPI003158AE3D